MCCTGFTNTLPIEARRGASPGWRNSHCAYLFPLFSAVIKILLAELITLSSSGSKTSISRPWPKLLKFVLFSYYKIEQLVYEKHKFQYNSTFFMRRWMTFWTTSRTIPVSRTTSWSVTVFVPCVPCVPWTWSRPGSSHNMTKYLEKLQRKSTYRFCSMMKTTKHWTTLINCYGFTKNEAATCPLIAMQ